MKEKTGIIFVSFGTKYAEAERRGIGVLESCVRRQYKTAFFQKVYTSQRVLAFWKARDSKVCSLEEALCRCEELGLKRIVIFATNIMDGSEYRNISKTARQFAPRFLQVRLSRPLLSGQEDIGRVLNAILSQVVPQRDTCVILMGHGSRCTDNWEYHWIAQLLEEQGKEQYRVALLEGALSIQSVIPEFAPRYQKAILVPLTLTAGMHVCRDMNGTDGYGWKVLMEKYGLETETYSLGLGESPEIRALFMEHFADAEQI